MTLTLENGVRMKGTLDHKVEPLQVFATPEHTRLPSWIAVGSKLQLWQGSKQPRELAKTQGWKIRGQKV